MKIVFKFNHLGRADRLNDRALSLLEQYDIEVLHNKKGRGAFYLDTNRGSLVLKEYSGNEDRVKLQERLLNRIAEAGQLWTEQIIKTKEDAFFVQDADGQKYLLKTCREGRELNIADLSECLKAVELLAKLHDYTTIKRLPEDTFKPFSILAEYEKRNRELKRVRKYLTKRSQKTPFELSLCECYDYFLEQAYEVTEGFRSYEGLTVEKDTPENMEYVCCHGDYQYHNIYFDGSDCFIINFEKCMIDNPIRDLFLLLRKLLEKNNWSVELGRALIQTYESIQPVSAFSKIDLYYRLAYPEKFWKIVNYYYNTGKSFIPLKNQEKLLKLVDQEQDKQHFLEEAFLI